MKEFIVKTNLSEVKFNFPTKLEELSIDYLKAVTDSITVSPYYSLIGIVYHERLANVIITCKNKSKKVSFGVVPIFIKAGKSDDNITSDAKIGQKLLIDNSQLQLAHHCAVPANKLTLEYFANVIDNSVDKELYQKAIQDKDQSEVLFIEFKIVPNNNIIAVYNDAKKVDNPYITINKVVSE